MSNRAERDCLACGGTVVRAVNLHIGRAIVLENLGAGQIWPLR